MKVSWDDYSQLNGQIDNVPTHQLVFFEDDLPIISMAIVHFPCISATLHPDAVLNQVAQGVPWHGSGHAFGPFSDGGDQVSEGRCML